MNLLKKYALNDLRVLNYLKKRFDPYDYLISRLLKECDFKNGEFYTLFLPGIEENKLYDFESGGILQINDSTENIVKQLPMIIQKNFLENHEDDIWVFEDALRNVSDNDKSLGFFYENELVYEWNDQVFYIINKNKSSLECISNCIENTSINWYYLSILTKDPHNLSLGRPLSDDQLKFFCVNAKKLVFGAYDAEGYIFWEKK